MHSRFAVLFSAIAAGALVVICSSARAQPTTDSTVPQIWNLQVCGSSNRIWYALSTPATANDPAHTYVRSRALQENWQELVDFPNRVLAMTSDGTEALVSLEGGEWARIVGEQFVSGPPLPGRADIVAMAADPQAVWAVAWANPPGTARTPATTTTPSGSTTTTKPSGPGEWSLFKLDGDHWNQVSSLLRQPAATQEADFSLVLLNHVPVLAYRQMAKSLELSQWASDTWKSLGAITCSFPIRKMSLLDLDGKLLIWTAADQGPGSLFFNNSGVWKSRPLQFAATFPVIDSALAAFNGELRLLAIGPHEQFQEQRYDAIGQPLGHATEIETPAGSNEITVHQLLNWSALGLLIIIALASTQRGSMPRPVKVKSGQILLAPLSLRLSAGLIDLWPLYLLGFLVFGHVHRGLVPSELYADRFTLWAASVCLVIYVLHPLIAEWIWSRSLGKMFVGLSVIAADGQAPSRRAIVVRNLLRLIEGPLLLGVPLLAIYFTPMRQRVGDMLAGTLVVSKSPRDAEPTPSS